MSDRTTDLEKAQTLSDLLRLRALHQPDRRAYTFLSDGETKEVHLTYGELDLQARAVAARLQALASPGERALLLYPPGLQYAAAFFGCLYAGIVAVPVYPPRPNRPDPRFLAILSDARARVVLTTSAILPNAERLLQGDAPVLWLATDGLNGDSAARWRDPGVGPDDLAFLQYTSGSTSSPKGVRVAHGNLLHNEALIGRAFGMTPESVVVGWLPLYHDMGLIGNLLQPLAAGCPCVLMSPVDFLQKPLRWLQAISRYGGTVSGGPNFAYDLCVRKIGPAEKEGLDLSRWQVAFNGAEPVRAETLDRFASAFAPCGFRREALFPCYGLAEATLFVTGAGRGEPPVVSRFAAEELGHNRAAHAADGRALVSSGRAVPAPEGQDVAIVDPETRRRRGPGEVGEIWIAGPSVARGYWSRPEATEATFRAFTEDGEGPFLRTGDLGFLDGAELYVTGRAKDLIIVRGRNLYPQDVELTVEKSHPALRPGCGAAFSVEMKGEERLVVVQEVRRDARSTDPAEVIGAIRRAVAEENEAPLEAIVLIRTASLPKTSSGKVRRQATREAFLTGGLAVVAAWEREAAATGVIDLVAAEPDLGTEEGARAWLMAEVAMRAGVPRAGLDPSEPLTRYALDSLQAMELAHAVEQRLGVPVSLETFFEGLSIAGLVERAFASRGEAEAAPEAGPRPGPGAGEHPLSHGQRALWFLHLLEPQSAAYNVPGAVTIEGELDAEALRRAFQALVDRHPVLRSTFASPEGEPVQRVREHSEVPFEVENVSRLSEEAFEARLTEEAGRPFDLERDPPVSVHLFERSKQEHVLLVSMHHVVTDFWSQALLLAELDALYPAARGVEGVDGEEREELPAPGLTYADFVRWQTEMLAGDRGRLLAAYWRGRLAGERTVLDLPTDRPRPPVQTYGGATTRVLLPPELSLRLSALARERGATLFMTLLAVFDVLLYRYTGQADLLVGVPTTGRGRAGFADVVGYFVNPVVLRGDLAGNPPFLDLLKRVRRDALGAFEHQDYPFPLLVEELQPERDPSRSPLFDVLFVLQKAPALKGQDLTSFALNEEGARLTVGGLPLVSRALPERIAQFDLTLTMGESARGITAAFNYNTDLFDADTIARMAGHFQTLVEGIVEDPARRLADLPLLTPAEQHRMLVTWNHTRAYYPEDAVIHGLFESQVDHTPGFEAVLYRDQALSYRELDHRANQLARHLVSLGIGPESLVGICLERSPELVTAFLGVLKTGAAYLPLDPEYPRERLAFLLSDARVCLVVTEERLRPLLPGKAVMTLALDADGERIAQASGERLPLRGRAENAACVIYTSGSTGRPKGVVLTHRNVVNLIVSFIRSYSPDVEDRLLPLTSVASASFVGEIFPILCADGAVVLPEREEILDTGRLIELIARRHVSILSTVPSLLATLNAMKEELPKLRLVLAGGEALSASDVDRILESATIVNGYGLTETAVCSTWYRVGMADLQSGGPLPIGRPLMNHQIYILDPELNLMPAGCTGKLYIAGDGVARGYLQNPALTADRFVPDPFDPGGRMYRTGDLASWLPDGNIVYHGRADQQVKVRGFRVELGEIETVLGSHPGVVQTIVVPRKDPGGKRLVAYVVPAPEVPPGAGELLAFLREKLPEPMVPGAFVFLSALPLSPNGKVDVKSLPAPERVRPELEAAYAAPKSELERVIAAVWQEALAVETVGIHDNFFDLGGHSLLLARVHARLKEVLGRELSLVDLFKNPTVSALAAALSAAPVRPRTEARSGAAAARRERPEHEEIAVVGLAGRFPGAKTVDQLWENLRAGREAIHFFTDEELLEAGVDPALVANPDYVKAKGILGEVDRFDAGLFGLSPREVELMDPQHRIFLECAWEALERAGYNSGNPPGRVGVFGGESMNTYLITNLLSHMELVASADTLQASLGNDKDPLTSRVSYKLNLKGPSITIQSASSTSLVAVHVATQSLLNRDCDMALAGGVSIHLPEISGYMYHDGGTTAPDGHCRAFDARAKGFVSGHGCGVVVLKRLADALRDGDHVHAVIKGSACNNDGSLKVSYTAPSVNGQVEVYSQAYENAGVTPDTLSYVECHGTATPMGDPIEIAALTQAFRAHTDRKGFCAIGSLKTNLGHLDSAAGVCGLIKTVLALEHRAIPPSLHFERPNPQIDFANSPFFVNAALSEWKTDGVPRRAGVTSLGMGGTNAHVILEEAPVPEPSSPSRDWKLLLLSAHTAPALEEATSGLAAFLDGRPLLDLADVTYTLEVGRRAFAHRRALLCRDLPDAVEALESRDPERILTVQTPPGDRPVVFLFTGQGAQYPNMARGLYESEPTFRAEVDRCCDHLRPHLGLDLRDLLFPAPEREEEAAEALRQTAISQPALFVVEYALATLWIEWGVTPQAMIGHSLGEYVAAAVAGVFSLRDALALVAARGRMMQRLPGGSMLAVPLPESEILPLLGDELSLAAVNRPSLCVVSGPTPAVFALRGRLAERGIDGRLLHTSHAFHSAMMDPILAPFAERVKKVKLQPPRMPYLSNVTGTWIRPEEATDPLYWAEHIRRPVRFSEGAAELLKEPGRVLLEVGPGNVLTTLVRQHPARTPRQAVLPSLRHPRESRDDMAFLLDTLARLWLAGVEVDWSGFHAHERRRRVPLPTYPFQRQRYWVEPLKDEGRPRGAGKRRKELSDWFYAPVWKQTVPPPSAAGRGDRGPCLVFLDGCGLGTEAVRLLEAEGHEVVTVLPGRVFERTGPRSCTIDAWNAAGYDALFSDLAALGFRPATIVHFWNVTDGGGAGLERTLELGFWSLLFLAQALGRRGAPDPVSVLAVSTGVQPVTGEEALEPGRAALLGVCRVIPREFPHIACRSLDVRLPATNGNSLLVLAGRVLAELDLPAEADPVAALRGRYRWVQELAPVPQPPGQGIPARLRERGVYLITGGLGGLGLEVADWLARTVSARLVLVGRTPLAEGDGRLDRIRELEALGAEVMVAAADVTDEAALAAVRDRAFARFGAVHGVIHAAGRPGGGILQVKTRDAAEAVLAPKVRGALALDRVFAEPPLDFLVLFSSITAVLAQPGQADYAAANAFLDAFARERTARGAFTLSIGWDAWRETGMAVATEVPAELKAWRQEELKLGMTSSEGVEALRRALGAGVPWLVVSTQDLPARIERNRASRTEEEIERVREARESHPRPLLANAYVAPRTEGESRVAAVWEELLGIEGIGVHDNFFDLGGNSLMAIRIISRLKAALGVDVSEVSIFEGPTVAALAKILEPEEGEEESYEDPKSRGEKRRAARRGRRAPVEVS